jgi:type IV pilus assembly protein PilP
MFELRPRLAAEPRGSHVGRRVLAALAVAALVAGCGGGSSSTPEATGGKGSIGTAQPAGTGPVAKPAPAIAPKEPPPGPPLPAVAYEPQGRRDPFVAVSIAREGGGITVRTVRLVGVVQGRQGLLALVEAPDGIGYILRVGDIFGDGRVTGIAANSVTFAVAVRGTQKGNVVTLRLATE